MQKIQNFNIGKYLVTKEQWDAIALWAKEHGYTDLSVGKNAGKQPVGNVTWFDALKFCNAASELAGLTPVYTLPESGEIYRTGICLQPMISDKKETGYRLPTSAEWEIACRAGTDTVYYWGDTLDAEYLWFSVGDTEDLTIHPVGQKKPNSLGLYDMSGNACEWCIDSYLEHMRILRGGSVALDAVCTSANEAYTSPFYFCYETSFRPISYSDQTPSLEELAPKSPYFGQFVKPTVNYPAMDEQSAALRLDSRLGHTPFAEQFHALVKEEKYAQALALSKEYMKGQLQKFSRKRAIPTFTEFNTEILRRFDGSQPFYGEQGECVSESPLVYICYYNSTGKEEDLNIALKVLSATVVRQKAEYDVMPDHQLNIKQIHTRQAWKWFMGFDNSTQNVNIINALWLLMDLGKYDLIPDTVVAQCLYFCMSESLYTMLKDGRANVPNQKIHVMKILTTLSEVCPDFILSDMIAKLAQEQIATLFNRIIYPDGTCLEQAFNYNGNVVANYKDILNEYPNLPIPAETAKVVDYLQRMLATSIVPATRLLHPGIGTCSPSVTPDLRNPSVRKVYLEEAVRPAWNADRLNGWKEKERMEKCLFEGDTSDAPRFQSVYFPYNAQAVIRDGFTWDSTYLFFYAPRKGSGHSVENINDIFFQAYGRSLLTNAGANSYGFPAFADPSQKNNIEELDSYQHGSYGRNTVMVDDSSQSRLAFGDSCIFEKYPTSAGNRYLDNEQFLYVEGYYSDGYYAADDVCHHREIFWHKQSKLFFILDSLTGKKEHKYTQNWNFAPNLTDTTTVSNEEAKKLIGFEDNEIITDLQNTKIYTVQQGQPNLYLYQFSAEQLSYSRNRGELHPAKGWFAPAIAGLRYPKTDIHTSWTAKEGTSCVLTVMEACPDTASSVLSAERYQDGKLCGCDLTLKDGKKLSFRFSTDGSLQTVPFDFANLCGRAILTDDADGIVMDGTSSYLMKNGCAVTEIKAPSDLVWEEKDGYSVPTYRYEK